MNRTLPLILTAALLLTACASAVPAQPAAATTSPDAAASGEVVAAAGCAGTADAQAVSRRAAVRMSGSVRFMCGSLLFK